jgi:hypothetical protein
MDPAKEENRRPKDYRNSPDGGQKHHILMNISKSHYGVY